MADAPSASGTRYGSLDAWRGVACLMVVLHHAGFAVYFDDTHGPGLDHALRRAVVALVGSMNLGVSLFFVISGYCIAASLDAARRRGDGPARFLARRVRRIYPPYWASLFGLAALTWSLDAAGLTHLHMGAGRYALQLDSPGVLDTAQWVGNLTLTESWRAHVFRPEITKVYTRVAWSLCFEEQFYFVGFLALVLARRRLGAALAVVTVVCLLVRVELGDLRQLQVIRGAFPLLWHEFAAGVLVYWRLNAAATPRARRAAEVTLAGLGLAGLLGGGYLNESPVRYSTAAVGLFGLVLIALRRWDAALSGSRWLAPLMACGRWSYSIYLTHLPVCTFLNLSLVSLGLTAFWARVLVLFPAGLVLSVVVGWVFFHAVERHFHNPPLARPVPSPSPSTGTARVPAAELGLEYS